MLQAFSSRCRCRFRVRPRLRDQASMFNKSGAENAKKITENFLEIYDSSENEWDSDCAKGGMPGGVFGSGAKL